MYDFLKSLSPKNQNVVQRAGFAGSIIISLAIIFLHFPFNGYDNSEYVVTHYGYGPCAPNISVEEVFNLTAKELRERVGMNKRCNNNGEFRGKSFSEWRSSSAIMPWFSSPLNTIITIVFSMLFGVVWVWIFNGKNGD